MDSVGAAPLGTCMTSVVAALWVDVCALANAVALGVVACLAGTGVPEWAPVMGGTAAPENWTALGATTTPGDWAAPGCTTGPADWTALGGTDVTEG